MQSRIFLLFWVGMQSRIFLLLRSSRQKVFFEKGLRSANLLKKRLRHRYFPVDFVKLLRTPFLTEYLWWLLLAIPSSLYWVEDFCYSVKVIYGTEHLFSAILSKLYWVEHFCYSKLVIQKMFILSRNFLQFCVV